MLELKKLPESLLVIGAGVIGCELAQLFSRAGVKVTLCCRNRLLANEEPEISDTLKTCFEKEGITVLSDIQYKQIRQKNQAVELIYQIQKKVKFMSDCCSSSCNTSTPVKKQNCPECNNSASIVSRSTIIKHIKKPWLWNKNNTNKATPGYYFCNTPDCEVVYFDKNYTIIYQSELRTQVGIKDQSGDSLICYCFGVTTNQAIKNPDIKEYVTRQTKEKICACDSFNPSGKCCLKDFPK